MRLAETGQITKMNCLALDTSTVIRVESSWLTRQICNKNKTACCNFRILSINSTNQYLTHQGWKLWMSSFIWIQGSGYWTTVQIHLLMSICKRLEMILDLGQMANVAICQNDPPYYLRTYFWTAVFWYRNPVIGQQIKSSWPEEDNLLFSVVLYGH